MYDVASGGTPSRTPREARTSGGCPDRNTPLQYQRQPAAVCYLRRMISPKLILQYKLTTSRPYLYRYPSAVALAFGIPRPLYQQSTKAILSSNQPARCSLASPVRQQAQLPLTPPTRPPPYHKLTSAPPSASKELLSDFNTLLGSDTHFGLLATIKSEQLVPVTFLTPSQPASSSTFSQNLTSLLAPHLQPKEALYVLLRRFDTAPYLTAVSYVPDAAPVRQKMLFASTRLTLTRELGSEHFRETVFATSDEELSARGFEKHDAHARLEAPLTEEERSLGEVKRAEAEAGSGTGTREIHLSKNLAMPVDQAAVAALKELGEEGAGKGLVMLVSLLPLLFVSLDVHSRTDTRFEITENQPRNRSRRASARRRAHAVLDTGAGQGHLPERAALHLLPLRPLVRRRHQQPRAVRL